MNINIEDNQAIDPVQEPVKEPTFVRSMEYEEKAELAKSLQKYHSIFKKFWQFSTIVFTDSIPTACVIGNRENDECFIMKINPNFWENLTFTQKLWVISHECLHPILNHLSRGKELEYPGLANRMMDIVINHLTVEKFGFKRSEIDPDDRYCWIDKFFTLEDRVLYNQSFEYYYNKILQNPDRWANANLLDYHEFSDSAMGDAINGFMKKMNKELTNEEKQRLKSAFGSEAGNTVWQFTAIKVSKKKKWESVIKKWVLKTIGHKDKDLTQWVHEDRRLTLMPKTVSLPFEQTFDEAIRKADKQNLFFFMDSSGSCISYGERFYRAIKSIPLDKFNIFTYSFDTTVYPFVIEKGEVKGGGGTDFQIMENKIQEWVKEGNKYPSAVWVITDGEAAMPTLEIPKNWHWFLTEDGSHGAIPKECNIYQLKDYE